MEYGESYTSGFSRYEACLSILTQEGEQVAIIASLQASIREAVIRRDWEQFETLLGSLDRIAEEFALLDEERARIFAFLTPPVPAPPREADSRDPGAEAPPTSGEGGEGDEGMDLADGAPSPAPEADGGEAERQRFYALVAAFPETQRRIITERYRRLKLDTLKIRLGNSALTEYLDEGRILVNGYLDAVFPARKQKTYSPRGYQVEVDLRSMLVNQQC